MAEHVAASVEPAGRERQQEQALLADRVAVLRKAVRDNDVDGVEFLVQRGASAADALSIACELGQVDVVTALHLRGTDVRAHDARRRTPLSIAASRGKFGVAVELVRLGADVNGADALGRPVLSRAAEWGAADAIETLIQLGANVHAVDHAGRTALAHAVASGRMDATLVLIRLGADATATDSAGRTVLAHAVASQRKDIVALVLRHGAFAQTSPSSDEVTLINAAVMGNLSTVQDVVVHRGADIEFKTRDGRTALCYAAEFNRLVVVQFLIESGANVAVKAQAREHIIETPLTLAGRAGHAQVFEALVRARAPVNVRRSANGGETPLVAAARADAFPVVQLLLAYSGHAALSLDSSSGSGTTNDADYPLLPGSLDAMEAMCASATHEFKRVCSQLLGRLRVVCTQLQDAPAAAVPHDALVAFASIVFRACRLLFDIVNKSSVLARCTASRSIRIRVLGVDDELRHFVAMQRLPPYESITADASVDDDVQQLRVFDRALETDDTLLRGWSDAALASDGEPSGDAVHSMALLLQYEVAVREQAQQHQARTILASILQRLLRACELKEAPVVPDWFLAPDDVEFHSWNLVATLGRVKYYDGTWRSTPVRIEASPMDVGVFTATAAQWHGLRHPNIVQLFGACHVRETRVFVYEAVASAMPLNAFARGAPSEALVWTALYQAALGLQYLHARGVVHGCVSSDSIVVGAHGAVKLANVGKAHRPFALGALRWLAPELGRQMHAAVSTAADIYAFGLCVWVAVMGSLPPLDLANLPRGRTLERPQRMDTKVYELIMQMCARERHRRPDIATVVRRLKQFVSEQGARATDGGDAAPILAERLDEHVFGELGGHSIPHALAYIARRCVDLADTQWMRTRVLPALNEIWTLVRERSTTAAYGAEVAAFCAVLARLQRYLRTAVSPRSVFHQMRSRQVAATHHVIDIELDRLLDMLDAPADDPIRAWRSDEATSLVCPEVPSEDQAAGAVHDAAKGPTLQRLSDVITLNHLDTPRADYEQWTRDGLAKAAAALTPKWRPAWYLSLQHLTFSESDQIGRGAFGAVCRGTWRGTPVVIKFMGYEGDIETISTDLLLHEVRVWHSLSHPHVLQFYGASHVDKRYFVCEFAGNGDLVAFLKTPGHERLVWEKLHDAALGLEYLHSRNVAHNDLKCDNIMVGLDGKAKVIDFGLSCLLGKAEVQVDVKKIGAVNWRSPEYLAGERPSRASDVYSFAMCILEAVSGDVPWGRSLSPTVVKFKVKRGVAPALPDTMTPAQRNLVALMTAFAPSERVSMAFVVHKLAEIAQDASAP